MLELKLVASKENEDKKYDTYKIGCYEVAVVTHKQYDNMRLIHISNMKERDGYEPDIYYNDGCFGSNEKKFEIQTTSYGSLETKEAQKFIAAYNTAIEVVEILTEKFLA